MERRDRDPDDEVHRAMLEHLERNPPPAPKARSPESPPPRSAKPATKPVTPPPSPRLMLRKMRLEPAMDRLEAFVREHRHRRTERVVVVVGRGLRSGEDGPVLAPAVRAWCDRRRDLVRDHHLAAPSEGGDGALVLYLNLD